VNVTKGWPRSFREQDCLGREERGEVGVMSVGKWGWVPRGQKFLGVGMQK
jgi:hypothetical protein